MAHKGEGIAVTGGLGFIGSNLVRALPSDAHIDVIDNLNTGSKSNLEGIGGKDRIRIFEEDARSIGRHEDARYSTIYHLGFYSASPMYRKDPHHVADVIDGMISVLEKARKDDSNVVFSSTSSIYNGVTPPHREDATPDVTDYYTEARIACERLSDLYHKMYGINVSAMRFFSVYGKYEAAKDGYANLATQFLWAMKKNEPPVIYGDGTQRRDFIYVEDVVEALKKASMYKGYDAFNVGTGKNYSLNELVDMLNKMLHKSIKARYVEMPVKNYVHETLADTSKAERKIGFRARVSLEEGLNIINRFY